MPKQPSLDIRAPRAGDGIGLARSWLDAATYYTSLNADLFQVPAAEGLAAALEAWALTTTDEHMLIRVAEQDQQVVGFIGATMHQPLPVPNHELMRNMSRTRLVIDVLVVQTTYWRQGVGTQLLSAAEAWGQSQGAVIVLVDTYIDSPVSVPFYEQHMGYERQTLRFRKQLA
jgi:GNAT superfamily N-acetyltransferase